MLISDLVKEAGKKLWPMTEGEPWQLEIIQRACNATALPFVESVIRTAKALREVNKRNEDKPVGLSSVEATLANFKQQS